MDTYDVIVVGGGPGGFCAAAAAAEAGAKTLLVERYGFLGGMATAGLVNPFMGYVQNGESLCNPVFNDFIARMDKVGALDERKHIFDDEYMKYVLDVMMADYGVDVLLHAKFLEPVMEGDRIAGIRLDLKEGLVDIAADIYVDSTGDGDLAAMAGARIEVGRDEDGLCQPMTLCFRVGGIDTGMIGDYREFREELTSRYIQAKADGRMDCPRENVLAFHTLEPSVLHFNTTRVIKTSGITSRGLTVSEIEARRQTMQYMDFFKAEIPAFKNSYLLKMAAQIGIRETRRVMSSYAVSSADVTEARKHADGIAKSKYPIDIHSPTGEGTIIKHLPEGEWYEIPYRCLLPEGVSNLVIGARSISSTHGGHSSLRVMPVVASIGEAAGLAAAKAAQAGITPHEVDGELLKADLKL